MSGVRWTTGLGIALGGLVGALAALLGAPAGPRPPQPVAPVTHAASSEPIPSAAPTPAAFPSSMEASAAVVTATIVPPPSSAASAAGAGSTFAPPVLSPPTTPEALVRAQVLCDQKKLYDECSRAAEALEKGTAGDVDMAQAKRFRKIALTHLVRECEAGDPHACFVMAAKYREGTELPASPVRAATLEKRGVELCRFRSTPECPAP